MATTKSGIPRKAKAVKGVVPADVIQEAPPQVDLIRQAGVNMADLKIYSLHNLNLPDLVKDLTEVTIEVAQGEKLVVLYEDQLEKAASAFEGAKRRLTLDPSVVAGSNETARKALLQTAIENDEEGALLGRTLDSLKSELAAVRSRLEPAKIRLTSIKRLVDLATAQVGFWASFQTRE